MIHVLQLSSALVKIAIQQGQIVSVSTFSQSHLQVTTDSSWYTYIKPKPDRAHYDLT